MDAHLQYKCRNCGNCFNVLLKENVGVYKTGDKKGQSKEHGELLNDAMENDPTIIHNCGSKFNTTFGVADLINISR